MINSLANTISLAIVFVMTIPLAVTPPLALSPAASKEKDKKYESAVGMPMRIEQIVLPGTQLVAKPLDETNHPIVLRITGVFPHGTDFRYDLEFYGLEPGTFDLRDYLKRKDGSAIQGISPLTVEIQSTLGPGQIEPTTLETTDASKLGGYRLLWLIGAIIWVIGLLLILFMGRESKRHHLAADRPLTVADRLRPLVEEAVAGQLSDSRLAELERALVALWRKRLKLDNIKAADAILVLRQHEQAGALLRQLEMWLHRPGGEQEVDVAAMLAPYQDLPADELSLSPQTAGTAS